MRNDLSRLLLLASMAAWSPVMRAEKGNSRVPTGRDAKSIDYQEEALQKAIEKRDRRNAKRLNDMKAESSDDD